MHRWHILQSIKGLHSVFSVIEYSDLKFICYLKVVFWNLI